MKEDEKGIVHVWSETKAQEIAEKLSKGNRFTIDMVLSKCWQILPPTKKLFDSVVSEIEKEHNDFVINKIQELCEERVEDIKRYKKNEQRNKFLLPQLLRLVVTQEELLYWEQAKMSRICQYYQLKELFQVSREKVYGARAKNGGALDQFNATKYLKKWVLFGYQHFMDIYEVGTYHYLGSFDTITEVREAHTIAYRENKYNTFELIKSVNIYDVFNVEIESDKALLENLMILYSIFFSKKILTLQEMAHQYTEQLLALMYLARPPRDAPGAPGIGLRLPRALVINNVIGMKGDKLYSYRLLLQEENDEAQEEIDEQRL